MKQKILYVVDFLLHQYNSVRDISVAVLEQNAAEDREQILFHRMQRPHYPAVCTTLNGYKTYTDLPAFRAGLEQLYRQQILPGVKEGLCGTVLTQLTDVEDETNGLVTYDRRVVKVDPAAMSALGADLQKELEA